MAVSRPLMAVRQLTGSSLAVPFAGLSHLYASALAATTPGICMISWEGNGTGGRGKAG
jgi:hypothetical protein